MSQREKEIIETFAEALTKMSEYDKGYFMGRAEGLLTKKNKEKQQEHAEEEQKGA